MTIVAHDRIDKNQRLGGSELLEEILDDADLLGGTQETGHDTIELQIQLLPLVDVGRHIAREILTEERGESGVVRENSRRQWATLYA
jgi:hypothetical protein